MEQIEAEARVKEKDWASILKEEMSSFKMDLMRNVKTLQDRDLETKRWVERAVDTVSMELKGVVDKKMIENEVTLKKMIL